MENVAKSLSNANKGLRKLIERGADEFGQLELFEDQFQRVKEKFELLKRMVLKNDKQTDELQMRLNKKLEEDCEVADKIEEQIRSLRLEIKKQNIANEKIQSELNDNVEKFHKLTSGISDHTNSSILSNSFQMDSSLVIERSSRNFDGF